MKPVTDRRSRKSRDPISTAERAGRKQNLYRASWLDSLQDFHRILIKNLSRVFSP